MKRESQDGSLVYQGAPKSLHRLSTSRRCCQSAKGEARTINTDAKEPLRQQMASKIATEAAKVVYDNQLVTIRSSSLILRHSLLVYNASF
jgi:transposase